MKIAKIGGLVCVLLSGVLAWLTTEGVAWATSYNWS